MLFEILIKNCLRVHEKRVSPASRQDLAIVHINVVYEKAVESVLD